MSKEAIERVAQAGDVYETLNVSPDATPAQIRKAYYQVSREVHPDKNNNSPEAEAAFQKVSEAYDALYRKPDKKQTSEQGLGAPNELLSITSGKPEPLPDVQGGEEKPKEEAAKDDASTAKALKDDASEGAGKGKKKDKDPMLELLDELSAFVAQTNKKITNALKEVGQEAWNKLKNTGPMQTLNKALNEAKEFINDKIDEGLDSVKNSAAVTAARERVDAIKKKIESSFSDVMNTAANAIARRVHQAVTPTEKQEQNQEPRAQNPEPIAENQAERVENQENIEESLLELAGLDEEEPEFSQGLDTPLALEHAFSEEKLSGLLAENDEANSKAITPFEESAEEENTSEINKNL